MVQYGFPAPPNANLARPLMDPSTLRNRTITSTATSVPATATGAASSLSRREWGVCDLVAFRAVLTVAEFGPSCFHFNPIYLDTRMTPHLDFHDCSQFFFSYLSAQAMLLRLHACVRPYYVLGCRGLVV